MFDVLIFLGEDDGDKDSSLGGDDGDKDICDNSGPNLSWLI